jgi:hypothetical protein
LKSPFRERAGRYKVLAIDKNEAHTINSKKNHHKVKKHENITEFKT